MLSMCMIVKNEEKFLEGALKAVRPYVDELVVVDTGSTDKSKQIATDCGATVFDFTWVNDFAAAKNFAASKAKNDWVFLLDADEFIQTWDRKGIKRLLRDDTQCGRIKVINNYTEDGLQRYYHAAKIFNRTKYQYEGIIHEQILPIGDWPPTYIDLQISAEHFGYMPDVVNDKDKLQRNIDLIKLEIERNPKDPYYYFQLAQSYSYGKLNLPLACEAYEKALSLNPDVKLEYVGNLIIYYGYALVNSKRAPEAMALEKYQKQYVENGDYLFMMGHVFMHNAQFEKSIQYFSQCIGKPCGTAGISSYLPNFNIGVIYECMNDRENAIKYYKRAGNYPKAKQQLKQLGL